jgi:D-alanyl-lipoteichoic acid acyltransferase DltB (MBOAT superfamily)
MLFNSYIYIFLFLPFTFFVYFALNRAKLLVASKIFLVLASLFFYSWWSVKYLPIMLFSIFFNYYIGQLLSKKRENKSILIFGIVANVSLLGYFKYADFLIDTTNMALNTNIELLHLTLPLAISFFTFQQIAYLVDSYKGETKEYSFLNYANFVTFFPQLIAGPIVHHKEMMPQFENISNKLKRYNNISKAIFIFSIGLFKKVIIADTFAIWANAGFNSAGALNMLEAWVTSLSYTFELYFDFSGYTDMAIGSALLFNIKLPINFNSPYKATSIQDFWRRWHITLSRFLRDYIYIPLGGNKRGEIKTYSNLFITFLIGGIWHGAGWNFIFWGFLHGVATVIHRFWSKLNFKLNTIVAWFITFNFINITWVFFRAKDWSSAIKILKAMFFGEFKIPQNLNSYLHHISSNSYAIYAVIVAFVVVLFFKNSNEIAKKFKPNILTLIFSAVIFLVSIASLTKFSEFLYFNF